MVTPDCNPKRRNNLGYYLTQVLSFYICIYIKYKYIESR